jgi:hypothetical protein
MTILIKNVQKFANLFMRPTIHKGRVSAVTMLGEVNVNYQCVSAGDGKVVQFLPRN